MYNLCYGMKVINITQLPGDSYSHPNYAMDLAGSDTGIDFWFSQGRWKCIKKTWVNHNTFMFVPVDEKGNYTKVHRADNIDSIVTIALTHSDSTNIRNAFGNILSTIKVGKIYENGIPMYQEGVEGNATANHIHLEVAEGIQTSKYYDTQMKVYRMKNELDPLKVFFVNKSFSTIKNSKGKTLPICDSIEYNVPKEIYLNAYKEGFYIRDKVVHGSILTMVPKGYKAKIIYFLDGTQSDLYQWAKVDFNGLQGYSQIDTSTYTLSSTYSNPVKLYTKFSAVRMRNSVVSGRILQTIPLSKTIDIIEFISGIKSDGYQWAKCYYNNKTGYCQLDTKKCLTLTK